jgi:hypothetical protein
MNPSNPQLGAGRLASVSEITEWSLKEGHLRELVEAPQRGSIWVILTEPEFLDMDKKYRGQDWSQYLRDHWQLVKSYHTWSGPKDMIVHVFRRDPPGSKH